MADVMDNLDDEKVIEGTKQKVIELCEKFPVYR